MEAEVFCDGEINTTALCNCRMRVMTVMIAIVIIIVIAIVMATVMAIVIIIVIVTVIAIVMVLLRYLDDNDGNSNGLALPFIVSIPMMTVLLE